MPALTSLLMVPNANIVCLCLSHSLSFYFFTNTLFWILIQTTLQTCHTYTNAYIRLYTCIMSQIKRLLGCFVRCWQLVLLAALALFLPFFFLLATSFRVSHLYSSYSFALCACRRSPLLFVVAARLVSELIVLTHICFFFFSETNVWEAKFM